MAELEKLFSRKVSNVHSLTNFANSPLQRDAPPANLWVNKAFQDYPAARCLLLNGLPTGFVLAQQAVEKLLKAYLRISHPSASRHVGPKGIVPAVLPVTPSHDLLAHASLVEANFPQVQISSQYSWLLRELSLNFERKYPDSPVPHTSSTTEWLRSIDELVVGLSLSIPLAPETRWRTGVFHSAWPLILTGQPDPPWSVWVRDNNEAFQSALPQLRQVIASGHHAAYPDQSL
jgi:hypothetical protein